MADGGTARTHATEPWKVDRSSACSIEQALQIAAHHGVNVVPYIRFVLDDPLASMVPDDAHAAYFRYGVRRPEDLDQRVYWEDFLRFGRVPVHVREGVLTSDEAIVAVFGHEVWEITHLREEIEANLHWQAVDFGDALVKQMRSGQ